MDHLDRQGQIGQGQQEPPLLPPLSRGPGCSLLVLLLLALFLGFVLGSLDFIKAISEKAKRSIVSISDEFFGQTFLIAVGTIAYGLFLVLVVGLIKTIHRRTDGE